MSDLIISLLKEIESDTMIEIRENRYDARNPLVSAIIYLANNYLTGDDRHVHMRVLKQNGFDIYPGEQDRFGWLTGCIQLEKGRIVFG
jgi:hypothetical protein